MTAKRMGAGELLREVVLLITMDARVCARLYPELPPSRHFPDVDTTRKRAVIAWVNGRSGNGVSDLVGLALDRARLQ